MGDVTVILDAIQRGETQATEELIPIVYDELRRLAASRLSKERPGQTIQATELVHEAYLRLLGSQSKRWQGRRHFFGAAAEAMRRILIDRARRKQRLKHGGHLQRVDVDQLELAGLPPDEKLLELNEALDQLAVTHPAAAELVKLRYFVGLSHTQAAEVLGLSRKTADNRFAFAKAWLFRALNQAEE